jgi:hypothetical protein
MEQTHTRGSADVEHAAAIVHDVPHERVKFKALLAKNPNYFGTVAESELPVVVAMSGNTTYEELDCVSFNPDQDLLEATVSVKLPFGYGGNLCSAGSREYVRFFLDYGSGWVDAGLTSIEVHDIPNGIDCHDEPRLPLTYTATVKVGPEQRRCKYPVLPNVRAILSWQVAPTGPTFTPVWGNVRECHIQVKPRPAWVIDLVDELSAIAKVDLQLPADFTYAGPIPLPGPDPAPLTLTDLAQLYGPAAEKARPRAAEQRVPAHRFGFAELAAAQASPMLGVELIDQQVEQWNAAGLSWAEAAAAIDEVDADVTFEQLECLGLDNNIDRLVATFLIKRPYGYNGGLCQPGSREYVAFWADWDNSCSWDYLGTVSVPVHDLSPLPAGGLCYAAPLKVDLTHQRRPCASPHVVRVRAVLSWNVPPSTVNPDALSVWGNRIDAHVQIAPGPQVPPGSVEPLIGLMGGIPVSHIALPTGLTDASAHFALLGGAIPADPNSLGRPCPFARRVAIQGPPFPGFFYRLQVKRAADINWQTVNNSFTVWDVTGTIPTLQVAIGDYFAYLGGAVNADNVLAEWDTAGDDLWDVKLDIQGVVGADQRRLQLHNNGPGVAIDIDVLAGNCGKFPVGTLLAGRFVARDEYLADYSLGTAPFPAPPGALSPPGAVFTQTAPPPGDPWSLDTTNMTPCGYVIEVTAASRAIYNSSPAYTSATATAGFCLEADE